MSSLRECTRCETPYRSDAWPGGLCPSCLLRLGLEDAPGPVPERDPDHALVPPETIGPYRILRRLGEGGMGSVYLAEQEGPLRRRVAVKLIKPGMDTREVVARFETERQVLAMLSHPCIAKVFEAGATRQGRPYFVMEPVDGVRITELCDRERLGIRARLKLFLQVCGAVQHAHQKGIIHRDLKPSNVLVEILDGEPTPKVIDFGVAKATGPGIAGGTLLTRHGAWIGTPAYMSPEAASSAAFEVDARTDIYALGVLLYELLCGALPFDPDRLHREPEEEVRRILREEDPPPPSHRTEALRNEADRIADRRRTDPAALVKRLRGDLDWIVMRAMEKDRDRRYASVSELANDVRRHLDHLPVSAGPPGAVYRLGKVVRRHRFAALAAGALLLTLLLGIAGTTVGLLRARAAERAARQEARTAREISDFLVGLFEVSDPGEARGDTVTAREILDDGARAIRTELGSEPAVRARLLETMGTVYQKLGLYEDAAALLEDALAIRRTRAPANPAEVARTLKELAVLHYRTGNYGRAEPLYRESLELARRSLGPEDPLVAWVLNDLGNIARDRGSFEQAESLFRRSLAIHETVYGPDHPYVANNLNNLANGFQTQGASERALPLRRRAQAIYETALGPDHPLVALGLTNLGVLHRELGEYERAEALYRRGLEIRERVLGPGHPDVAVSLYHLAGLYRDQGLYDRADPLYERALAVGEEALGDGNHRLAAILRAFAGHLRATDDDRRAEALLRRAVSILEGALQPRHARVARALADLAGVVADQGRSEEARVLFDRALAIHRELDAGGAGTLLTRTRLASALVGLGELQRRHGEDEAARRSWEEAAELMEPLAETSRAVEVLHVRAMALLHLGRAEAARPTVEALLATGWRDPRLLDLCRRRGLL
jgi:non-specific serine/threonine protein kinase/serine/threonine-protein kinase